MDYEAVSFADKFTKFSERFQPKVIAQMNDYQFKLARAEGDFVWHSHEETDETFLVIEGELVIEFRDGRVVLGPGEMFVVPKGKERLTLVICPEITNVENIGSMVRIAAAFGADAMILGERCHDPFWRQSIRVSMGTIFSLPLYQARDLMADLRRLKLEWGVELAATVLDAGAERLGEARRPGKFGLLIGSEPQGLGEEWVAACERKITIPMHWGTDSLNVAVATGIFLYHFTRE